MHAGAVTLALLCALQTRQPGPRRAPALTPLPAPALAAPSELVMHHAITEPATWDTSRPF